MTRVASGVACCNAFGVSWCELLRGITRKCWDMPQTKPTALREQNGGSQASHLRRSVSARDALFPGSLSHRWPVADPDIASAKAQRTRRVSSRTAVGTAPLEPDVRAPIWFSRTVYLAKSLTPTQFGSTDRGGDVPKVTRAQSYSGWYDLVDRVENVMTEHHPLSL